MLILKYQKLYPASLVGHVDTLRTLTAVFRRAKVNVQYSQGFNPHMQLFISQATSLGTQSLAEYVAVETNDDHNTILQKLNPMCPKGLTFSKVFVTENISLASKIDSADYQISAKAISSFLPQLLDKEFCITYTDKNGKTTKNVADKIFFAEAKDNDTLHVRLACGQTNLRPDRLVCSLLNSQNLTTDYDILKTQAYIQQKTVDQYLSELQITSFHAK